MICAFVFALALVASVCAAPNVGSKRQSAGWSATNWRVSANEPVGPAGAAFEQSVGLSTNWSVGAGGATLKPKGGTVAFRLAGEEDSAVVLKNRDNATYWLTSWCPYDPLQFGIYDNDVWITTNYSAAAPINASAGAWHTIPISADVQISSPVGYRRRRRSASIRDDRTPWNATVYGKDGRTTVHMAAGSAGLNFHVVNILEIHNITFAPAQGVYVRPHVAPLLVQYADPASAPLVTANMHIFGGFSDDDD